MTVNTPEVEAMFLTMTDMLADRGYTEQGVRADTLAAIEARAIAACQRIYDRRQAKLARGMVNEHVAKLGWEWPDIMRKRVEAQIRILGEPQDKVLQPKTRHRKAGARAEGTEGTAGMIESDGRLTHGITPERLAKGMMDLATLTPLINEYDGYVDDSQGRNVLNVAYFHGDPDRDEDLAAALVHRANNYAVLERAARNMAEEALKDPDSCGHTIESYIEFQMNWARSELAQEAEAAPPELPR